MRGRGAAGNAGHGVSLTLGCATLSGVGAAPRSDRLKGARFGAHEIVRLIGHGATASVYEAVHVGLGKAVAIKLLHEHLATDEHLTARFVREGRVAARLAHPNAIDVLDVGVEDGVAYLAMELLRGSDLRAILADVGALPIEHAMRFLLPIASALQHAHDAGVLHRDLKPANIFLARDVRDDVVPKLVDFGLSKVVTGEMESALTQTELVAGTVLYMAPEQTHGVRFASPASDQYSLAAVVYEAITGAPPFDPEGGIYALIERVRTTSPRPPSAARPGVPPAIDGVILRAMEHEPAARYESVGAFARDLLPFADEATRRTLERDFVPRSAASGSPAPAGPSSRTPSGRELAASAETRAEILVTTSSVRAARPLPCRAGTSPFHIKGLFYKGFVHAVSATIGLEAFCEGLVDPDLRAFLRQPFLASGRYDVLPFVPLTQAMATRLGVALDELVRTSTAAQARYDAKHVYKLIFDSRDPAAVADRISRFNTQIYDFGTFRGEIPEPGRITIEFSEIPAFLEPWFGPMHVAYTVESLRIAGAADVGIRSHVVKDAGTRDGFPLQTFRTSFEWR
jgi:serine/threonine protein kinase